MADVKERHRRRSRDREPKEGDCDLFGWVRDLTEEGIEPNPGPIHAFVLLDKNVNGWRGKGRLKNGLRAIADYYRRNKSAFALMAATVQEHNLSPKDKAKHNRAAHAQGLLMLTTYAKPAIDGIQWGGAAIVMPYEGIEKREGESTEQAVARVRATFRGSRDGRTVTATTLINGRPKSVMSAYAPAKGEGQAREAYFKSIANRIKKNSLIGIDANCVPDVSIDHRSNSTSSSAYENGGAALFEETIIKAGLMDVQREHFGDERFFTSHHRVRDGTDVWTRLDQLYAADEGDEEWKHFDIPDDFPRRKKRRELDHSAVAMVMDPPEGRQTRGVQVPFILEDIYTNEEFAKVVAQNIRERHQQAEKTGMWAGQWERMKIDLRKLSLDETRRRKFTARAETKAKLLKIADMRKDRSRGIDAHVAEMDELELEVAKSLRTEKTLHETLEREAYTHGKRHDVSSKEFFRPWRPSHKSQAPTRMRQRDWTSLNNPRPGGVTHDQKGIIAEFTKYFKALYRLKPIDPHAKEECLDTLRDPTLPRPQKPTLQKCGDDIDVAETLETMQHLPTGKSPGPDRLPNTLYKTFAKLLAPFLTKVLNEGRKGGRLPATMLQGITSVLYKKKDPTDPRNYRPITLLNNDYKILTRILTARMNEAVKQFVSPQQNGFVPDGFIAENTMLLNLLKAWVEDEDSDAIFIFLDMEKAFDRCSWEYLHDGLDALGFGDGSDHDDFTSWVKLFYSHDQPPTRQLAINGWLGERYTLHSGVAQGCSLSPLLFLVIAEALTRLIQNDPTIEGIETGDIVHKISQYADDSTLIGRLGDTPRQLDHVQTWEEATSALENDLKREAALIGKVNRERERAPTGIVKDDAWVEDGDHIITLGVPLGNDRVGIDWWWAKYKQIKHRLSAYYTLGHLSITGRRMVIQGILYGSMRYWLFSDIVPDEIVAALQEDAYHLMWAGQPIFKEAETGSSHRASRAYIHKAAAFLPENEGGAGAMDLKSHAKAFRIQWVKRLLEPGCQPWKAVVKRWILRNPTTARMGTRSLLYAHRRELALGTIPEQAAYLRACIGEFIELNLHQSLTPLTYQVNSESIFDNPRIDLDLSKWQVRQWEKYMRVVQVKDAINHETGHRYTTHDMSQYIYANGFHPPRMKTAELQEWADEILPAWSEIRNAIGRSIARAATSNVDCEDGSYWWIESADQEFTGWAEMHMDENETITYETVVLDVNAIPHRTGTVFTAAELADADILKAATWTTYAENYFDRTRQLEEEDPPEPEVKKKQIAGTLCAATAQHGWMATEDDDGIIKSLQDLTIKKITKIYTTKIIGSDRPNCEEAWESRLGVGTLPWDRIWRSIGTPFSDPTEEKAFRKLAHRATYVHNRGGWTTTDCRLGCGATESMQHMLECPGARAVWNEAFQILTALGFTRPHNVTLALVTGIWKKKSAAPTGRRNRTGSEWALGHPVERAFLRHTLNEFYREYSKVDLLERQFVYKRVMVRTLQSFRSAVLRFAFTKKLEHTRAKYNGKQHAKPSLDDKTLWDKVLYFNPDTYNFRLLDVLKNKTTEAEAALEAYYQSGG